VVSKRSWRGGYECDEMGQGLVVAETCTIDCIGRLQETEVAADLGDDREDVECQDTSGYLTICLRVGIVVGHGG